LPSQPAADRAALKAERAASRGAKSTASAEDDPLCGNYGDLALIQSESVSGRTWTRLSSIDDSLLGSRVLVRGRVHAVRGKGKSAFLVLRQGTSTLQVVLFVDEVSVSKGMVKYVSALPKESVVELEGLVARPAAPLTGVTVGCELCALTCRCVSRAAAALPFDLEDASRCDADIEQEGSPYPRVGTDTRLDNRVLDLRTPANHATFRIQAAVGALFREALMAKDFVEIHTPKLISGASEGGASVFKLNYMGQPACLAQSPQLYKQARAPARGSLCAALCRALAMMITFFCVNRQFTTGRYNMLPSSLATPAGLPACCDSALAPAVPHKRARLRCASWPTLSACLRSAPSSARRTATRTVTCASSRVWTLRWPSTSTTSRCWT